MRTTPEVKVPIPQLARGWKEEEKIARMGDRELLALLLGGRDAEQAAGALLMAAGGDLRRLNLLSWAKAVRLVGPKRAARVRALVAILERTGTELALPF